MKQKVFRKWGAYLLAASMLFSMNGMSTVASAAQKAPKLSAKSVTVKVGATKKVTLKNKPAKAKVTWTSQNKKIATVKNGKIKGVKKGNTKVICKVVYKKGSKKVTKKLSAKVKVTAKAAVTPQPSATQQPAQNSTVPAISQAPAQSTAPAQSEAPVQSVAPSPGVDVQELLKQSNVGEEHLSANGLKTKDNGLMRKELSSQDLMSVMSLGWNLGNQMEQSNCMGGWETIEECETSAGNPKATQRTFDGLKSYGVNTVRVPVAWSNFIAEDYTLNEDLLKRVEEIINYALNDEMYVIINIHWDGGWWGRFGAEEIDAEETPIRDEAWKKYEAIWTQICERYKEYSDHLIFEGANEELSGRLNDDYEHPEKGQANQTGKLPKDADAIYELVNQINQKFVDIVRASGGNNAYRHLLIPGTGNESCVIGGYPSDEYQTDGTMDDRYKMPQDTDENGHSKLSVSIHYYDPTDYGISATSTTPWGYRDSWGTEEDYKYMAEQMDRLTKFTDEGYAVILGECGCVKGYKDNVIDFTRELFTQALNHGYCPVLWDEGHYFEREKGYFAYGDVGELFAEMTGSTPNIPDGVKLVNTGISVVPTVENTDPKVVYSWKGEFMRHTGDGDIPQQIMDERGDIFDPVFHGIGVTDSITDGDGNPTEELQAIINEEYWNIHLSTDWSKIEEPCIRVYPMDNEASMGADLQVGYMKKENSGAKFDVDYDQNTGQMWVGKYVKLDAENLQGDYPWLWITTNTYTGASYVQIDICDGAYNADGTRFEQ